MKEAKAGDVVELADKTIGFTDPDTGFDISRDSQAELTDPIGRRTQIAIASGALLIVKPAKEPAKKATKKDSAETTDDKE